MGDQATSDAVPTKGRLLVVDDDDALVRTFERTLRRDGYEVATALDGTTAIELLRQGTFDAVISDISMPEMNGIELLRAVREHDLDIPVVIVTGTPDVSTAVRAIEHGALRYLIKPVGSSELRTIVEYAVRMCRMARIKREALLLVGDPEKFVGDRAGLEAHFSRALGGLWMAYQPIVSWSKQSIFSYEALLRSSEPRATSSRSRAAPSLPSPGNARAGGG